MSEESKHLPPSFEILLKFARERGIIAAKPEPKKEIGKDEDGKF